jgi:1,4-dihydroxy-2-naphthoyl-CoA synthase
VRGEDAAMSDTITQSRAGSVLALQLERPHKLNAFNDEMCAALIAALDEAAADSGVRVIVITRVLVGPGSRVPGGADALARLLGRGAFTPGL